MLKCWDLWLFSIFSGSTYFADSLWVYSLLFTCLHLLSTFSETNLSLKLISLGQQVFWLVSNLADSAQVFIIRFQSLCRVNFEIRIDDIFVVFSSFSFRVSQMHCFFTLYLCTWNKNSRRLQDTKRIFHVGYQGGTCRSRHSDLSSESHVDLNKSFLIGNIMWLYYTQILIIITAPVTDVTLYS